MRGIAAFVSVVALWVLVLAPVAARGQLVREANAFLTVGYCARSEALARADMATDYYVGQGRSNPASLSSIANDYAVGGSFSRHFAGMANLGYAACALRADSLSGVAVGLLRFGVSGIQNTLRWMDSEGNTDYTRITRFGVADYGLFVAYGRDLPVRGLSAGAGVKVMYRHEGGFANGVGIGFDAGIRYVWNNWAVAAVARDITSTWTLWFLDPERLAVPENDSLSNGTPSRAAEMSPPSLDIAGSGAFALGGKFRIGVEVLFALTFDGGSHSPLSRGFFAAEPALGLWGSYRDALFIRLGVRQFQLVESLYSRPILALTPSAGIGVSAYGCSLDYAFVAPLTGLTMRFTHLVSLSVGIGESKPRGRLTRAHQEEGVSVVPIGK